MWWNAGGLLQRGVTSRLMQKYEYELVIWKSLKVKGKKNKWANVQNDFLKEHDN